jgi:hypothetical protein
VELCQDRDQIGEGWRATITSVVNLSADPEQDGWLTLSDAADRLGVSIYTIRR